MTFRTKDFARIAADMVGYMQATQGKLTDFSPGSVARTLVEAPAVEIDELYQMMLSGLLEAIPVSTFNSFDFAAKPAVVAGGRVVLETNGPAPEAIHIPAGTLLHHPGHKTIRYLVRDAVTIAPGQRQAQTVALAEIVGTAGNAPAYSISATVGPLFGIARIYNPDAFITGQDPEEPEARRVRFLHYVSTLARGTRSAIEYGAMLAQLVDGDGLVIERAQSVVLIEPWQDDPDQPIGLVELYIHNGDRDTTPALVAQASKVVHGYYENEGLPEQMAVPGWKAAGVICRTYAAEDVPVDVTGVLTLFMGYDDARIALQVEEAIRSYIRRLPVGGDCLFAEIIAAAMEVPGIYNVIPTEPLADVRVGRTRKAIPGTITLTVAELHVRNTPTAA